MYLESIEDTVAILEFQRVDLNGRENFCLTFWYHLYQDSDYMKETLNVTLDNELAWTENVNQENKWRKGTIDLHNKTNMSIKFIGILGSNYLNNTDIAIDDISLAEGTCTGML